MYSTIKQAAGIASADVQRRHSMNTWKVLFCSEKMNGVWKNGKKFKEQLANPCSTGNNNNNNNLAVSVPQKTFIYSLSTIILPSNVFKFTSSIHYGPRHPPCLVVKSDNLFHGLSPSFSLICLQVLNFPPGKYTVKWCVHVLCVHMIPLMTTVALPQTAA